MTARRTLLLACLLLGASVNAGSTGPPPAPRIPAERMVSFGFEDVVTHNAGLPVASARLDRANVNSISISAGRLDWTAFPWDEHPESASAPVQSTHRDYVGQAIRVLGGEPRRRIVITIDALVPRWIERDPSIAGVGPTGIRSTDFASVSALADGPVGDRLVSYVGAVASRYHPDAIELTELMFDDATFGPDDLASYRAFTSHTDWPRTADGSIDTTDASLSAWRSASLASLVGRAARASHAQGVELQMDVRAPWQNPGGDRPESGHDYAMLARVADRLVVWDYFALAERPPAYSRDLARSFAQRQIPVTISVGMWGKAGAISAEDLAAALRAAAAGGAESVAATPASLLGDEAWRALERVWAR